MLFLVCTSLGSCLYFRVTQPCALCCAMSWAVPRLCRQQLAALWPAGQADSPPQAVCRLQQSTFMYPCCSHWTHLHSCGFNCPFSEFCECSCWKPVWTISLSVSQQLTIAVLHWVTLAVTTDVCSVPQHYLPARTQGHSELDLLTSLLPLLLCGAVA